MPLYEYQCDACGARFERIQKFSDPLVETCPQCGKQQVRKLLSSPAIQFKGSGWYITDYARKGVADSDSSKADSAAKTDGKEAASEKSSPEKGASAEKTASGASSSPSESSSSSPETARPGSSKTS